MKKANTNFYVEETTPQGGDGHYRIHLHPRWNGWGPFGGYMSTIALRAMAAHSRFSRPASFNCMFLSAAKFDLVDLHTVTLHSGKRSEAIRVSITQKGKPILEAQSWMVDHDMQGLEHNDAVMPKVQPPEQFKPFQELADDFDEWPRFWRLFEGRPEKWIDQKDFTPQPPKYRVWLRLLEELPSDDHVLKAARSIMWLDYVMWMPVEMYHGWPPPYMAPNMDIDIKFCSAQFGNSNTEWLLAEGYSPEAADGLVASKGGLWSPEGKLMAISTATLICRPFRDEYGS